MKRKLNQGKFPEQKSDYSKLITLLNPIDLQAIKHDYPLGSLRNYPMTTPKKYIVREKKMKFALFSYQPKFNRKPIYN